MGLAADVGMVTGKVALKTTVLTTKVALKTTAFTGKHLGKLAMRTLGVGGAGGTRGSYSTPFYRYICYGEDY